MHVIGPIDLRRAEEPAGIEPLPAPGMLARHYAPGVELECIEEAEQIKSRVKELESIGFRVGVITPLYIANLQAISEIILPNDPAGFASGLYSAMHRLDDAQLALDKIIAWLPPSTDEWFAVRDRLTRAARPATFDHPQA